VKCSRFEIDLYRLNYRLNTENIA